MCPSELPMPSALTSQKASPFAANQAWKPLLLALSVASARTGREPWMRSPISVSSSPSSPAVSSMLGVPSAQWTGVSDTRTHMQARAARDGPRSRSSACSAWLLIRPCLIALCDLWQTSSRVQGFTGRRASSAADPFAKLTPHGADTEQEAR